METYKITHSLLSAWLYAMKENPFEDATTENSAYADFLRALRREPVEPSEAMTAGIDFENAVTDYLAGNEGYVPDNWINAVSVVASHIRGARLQVDIRKVISVNGLHIMLHGRLDALHAGTIFDIKFSKSYDRGKYFNSTQHPMYFALCDSADQFTYEVSNGSDVWTETYRRDETAPIEPIISDFLKFLQMSGLMKTYRECWLVP